MTSVVAVQNKYEVGFLCGRQVTVHLGEGGPWVSWCGAPARPRYVTKMIDMAVKRAKECALDTEEQP